MGGGERAGREGDGGRERWDARMQGSMGQVGRETGKQEGREAGRQGAREAGKQGGREAGRQGGREGGREAGRERVSVKPARLSMVDVTLQYNNTIQ